MTKYTRNVPGTLEADRAPAGVFIAYILSSDKKLGMPRSIERARFGDWGSYRLKYRCVSFQDSESENEAEEYTLRCTYQC